MAILMILDKPQFQSGRIRRDGHRHHIPGDKGNDGNIRGYRAAANNHMEMRAVLTALQVLSERCLVHLYSDSRYVINTLTSLRNQQAERIMF